MMLITGSEMPTAPVVLTSEELRIVRAYQRMDDQARGDTLAWGELLATAHPRHAAPALRLIAGDPL